MRNYCEDCDDEDPRYFGERPTLDDKYECVCGWIGFPYYTVESTRVPYGDTWSTITDIEDIICPECGGNDLGEV